MATDAPQRSQEWLDARKGKITASIAAACLGLDPHTSRQKAWRIILDREVTGDNRHMAWGREFEEAAKEHYQVTTGALVRSCGLVVHPWYPWLAASPDGLVGDDGLVEVKCPQRAPHKVPTKHRIQMMVQLACTGRTWCDYFCFVGQETFLERVDRRGTPGLVEKLAGFYLNYVFPEIEPPKKTRRRKR